MPDSIDVFATAYGEAPSRAIAQSAAHLGYETSRGRPPDDLDVEFCDYNFRDETPFDEHLQAVGREQPKVAVAPDVEVAADLDAAVEQADKLDQHAETVVMVPKGVHPTEIPGRFRVGLPLANWDMPDDDGDDLDGWYDTTGKPKFHPWSAYFDVGEVHLLGGGPMTQLEVSKFNIRVASVDGASPVKAAQKGGLFTPDKWLKVTADCPGLYEAMRHSLDNLVRAWSVRYNNDPPISANVYDASECAEEIAEAKREARQQVEQDRAYRDAGHGPAYIEPGDEDLWGPQDYDDETVPEVVDWEARMNEAEQRAAAAARRELEKVTDGGQPELGAFTGGSDAEEPDAGTSTEAKSAEPGMADYLDRLGKQAVEADEAKRRDPEMFYVKSTIGPQDWLEGENVLVSAGAAWRNPGDGPAGDGFNLDPPDETDELMVDSGGYQAAVHFQDQYPYSPEQLFDYAERIGADYCFAMDWACETPEQLAALYEGVEPEDIAPVSDRIERSIRDQKRCFEVYREGDWSFDLLSVVQGLDPEDYRYHARRMRQEGFATEYAGIGTVCKRTTVDGISDVLDVCREELPATEFHLFGATKNVWKDRTFRRRFRSADTHAWARKTPEGEWTSTKDDKRRAWEAYSADIEKAREQFVNQSSFGVEVADRRLATSLISLGARICVCGTLVPPYYDPDFEPGCRHCESTMLNRWDAALAAEEELIESGYAGPDTGNEQPATTDSTLTDDDTEAVEVYDPTDDTDDSKDSPKIMGFGDYREQGLKRLEDTPHLDPIKTFDSIDELVEAVGDIHVEGYSNPPEKTMERLRSTYEGLPNDEARRYYLNDYKLVRTVNAARRAFNEWVGRKKRYDRIPGWAEAGPSNYPVGKQNKARDSERKGRETLDEKLDRLRGRVKGARQRALKKAGTSVAEVNEAKREEQRAEGREQYEKGDIVLHKHYVQPWGVFGVKKVNKKSLTLSSPHPNPGVVPEWGTKGKPNPDFQTTNAKLDRPQAIKGPIPPEEWEELDERHGLPRDYREAQIELFGEAWVERHLADEQPDDQPDTDDPTRTMSRDTLADELKEHGLPPQGANAIARKYDTLEEAFEALPSQIGDLDGVGPATVEKWKAARAAYNNRDEEPDERDQPSERFDPKELLGDDVEYVEEIEWQDIEHPENVPKSEKEVEIDLAKRILQAGGNRTGFGHHEEKRASMEKWVKEMEGHENDPGYWRDMVFKMGPHERSSGRLDSDDIDPDEHPQKALNRRYQKAVTVIAWASDNIPTDVLRDIEDEQAKAAADEWLAEAEEQATKRADAEFESDPPAEVEGWQRWDDHGKDDVLLAYRGMNHDIPSVVALYDTGDRHAAGEYALSDWLTSKPAKNIGKNSVVLARDDRSVYGEVRSHLENFGGADGPIPDEINGWERYDDELWTYRNPENTVHVTVEEVEDGFNAKVESDWGTVERLASGEWQKKAIDAATEWMENVGPGAAATEAQQKAERDAYDGPFANKRMENAHYWAAQVRQWMFDGPNAGLEGTFYVEIRAGNAVLVLDGDEWSEGNVKAITDALRDEGFPEILPKNVRELDDEWRVFITPTDDRLLSYYDNDWREFESDSDFSDTERDDHAAFGEGQEPPLEVEEGEATMDEWRDDPDDREKSGLELFGMEIDEGTGTASREHRAAQNKGYIREASEPSSVENEREGLGRFGARPADTKGLEQFEEPEQPADIVDPEDVDGEPPGKDDPKATFNLPESVGDWELIDADAQLVRYERPWPNNENWAQRAHVMTGSAREKPHYAGGYVAGQGDSKKSHRVSIGEYQYADRSKAVAALLDYLHGDSEADDLDPATVTRDEIEDVAPVGLGNGFSYQKVGETSAATADDDKRHVSVHYGRKDDDRLVGERIDVKGNEGDGWEVYAHYYSGWEERGGNTSPVHESETYHTGLTFAEAVEKAKTVAEELPYSPDPPSDDWDAEAAAAAAKEAASAKDDALYELTNEQIFGPAFDGYTSDELARLGGVSASDWDDPYQHDERDVPADVREAEDAMFKAFAEKDAADQEVRDYLDLPDQFGDYELETVGESEIRYARDEGDDGSEVVVAQPIKGVGVEVYRQQVRVTGTAEGTEDIGTFDKLQPAADAMLAYMAGETDDEQPDDSEAEQAEFTVEDDASDTETLEVEFPSRDAANAARDDLPDGAETNQYDRRHKTVEVYVGALSDSEREQFEDAALDARRDKDVKYGQADLTDNEKRLLKKRDGWTWGTHGFHARSAKAILTQHGVDDWLAKYDHEIEAKEHHSVVPDRGNQPEELLGVGTRGGDVYEVDEDDPQVIERQGKAAAKAHSEECDNAEKYCGKGDEGACVHLKTECGWDDDEIEEMRADVMEMEARMDALITDDGGPIEEGEPAIEPEVAEVADTEQLPPFALRTLQRAWNGFRAAALEAEEGKEAVENYREARREARQYGAMVNEVRGRFGQDPIEIEATVTVEDEDGNDVTRKVRLADLPELEGVEWGEAGDTSPTGESEGVNLYASGFYDPVDEMRTDGGAVAAAPSSSGPAGPGVERVPESGEVGDTYLGSEFVGLPVGEAAEKVHRQRSAESQEMDDSIQAREQVGGLEGFEKWLSAPNMMDFVGVDDLKMMGLGGLDN